MSVVIDIVIVLVLIGCLVHGLRRGLIGTLGSVAGLALGGTAAWFFAAPIGSLLPDRSAQPVATLVAALVLVLVGTGIGARIGSAVGSPVRRSAVGPADRVLGGGAQLVAGAFAVTVVASLAVTLGTPVVAQPIAGSVVAQRIEQLVPGPVDQAVHGIETQVLAAGTGAVLGAIPGVAGPR